MKNKRKISYFIRGTLMITAMFVFSFCNNSSVYAQQNETNKRKKIQIALLLDTSNSMDGLIDQAKSQLWRMVDEMSKARCGDDLPKLEIALYEYGNDNLPMSEGYIRQVSSFTTDLDEISSKLFSLRTNGGQEFCGQVIKTSIKELEWSKSEKDIKLIFIAGNEPFSQGKVDFRGVCRDAKEKDIIVNTIFCGNYDEGLKTSWRDGALLGGGDFMAINHNIRTVYVSTPYDDRITILNTRLNNTYIYYGRSGVQKKTMQEQEDMNAYSISKENSVARSAVKASGYYDNSSWDLVDACKKDKNAVKNINKQTLPDSLKTKSQAEIELYVKQKSDERAAIQKEIRELNTKRQQYIAQKNNNNSGNLDNAIMKSIKIQAEKKNFVWN